MTGEALAISTIRPARAAGLRPDPSRACECGRRFTVGCGSKKTKYCSSRCRLRADMRASAARRQAARSCPKCSGPIGRGKKVCQVCTSAWLANRRAADYGSRTCRHCGEQIDAAARPEARLCSERCRLERKMAQARSGVKRWKAIHVDRAKLSKRNTGAIRRARKRGASVEAVDRNRVFALAQGVCGICEVLIDVNSNWHVDHVIPLSRGGAHSYANTQPAHADCNLKKGSRHPTPLAEVLA